MDFHVIDGPPDEIVQWKYIEEVRPRRDRPGYPRTSECVGRTRNALPRG